MSISLDSQAQIETLATHYRAILQLIGENPEREGLLKTPQRVAKAMAFLTQGYSEDARSIIHSARFREQNTHGQSVIVKDIEFFSLCEHHMLPFWGIAHIAYVPNEYIVGLSKIPRLVNCFARRLQVQERLTTDIMHAIQDYLKPLGVGVVIKAQHMCMMMRGVEKKQSATVTTAYAGELRDNKERREEFLRLINH